MKRNWLIPFSILGIAIIIDLVILASMDPVPVLTLSVDIGSVVLILGILAAMIGALVLYLLQREDARISEAQAQAAQDRRSFLQRLDHELKNPITAIFMGAANLRAGSQKPEEVGYVESIETHARRLQRLTADLRKLTDLEQRPIEQIEVDLDPLLRETFAFCQESHPDQQREYSIVLPEVPWPLPRVRGDPDLLQLAFHNLLDNAVKYSDPGDSVELRASEDGSRVVVEVADTGQGIPAEEISHVWEELYRGAGSRAVPGSGLGLALVRAIIERHSGTISLRSRPAEGTVVTIRLPAI